MILQFRERNEIKTDGYSLKEFYDANSIDYDDLDDGIIHQEVDLRGYIGYTKVNNKTLNIEFNDGEIIRVNVSPKKMASVIAKISDKDLRKQKVRVKCY